MIEITVTADGFLRYMVPSIVGTLGDRRGEIDQATVTRVSQPATALWLELPRRPGD